MRRPETAWRTIGKMNASLPAGGTALLRRGDVFYGGFTLPEGLDAEHPTTIAAYGEGPKPVISCLKTITPDTSVWDPISEGLCVWRVDLRNQANYTGIVTDNTNPGFLLVDGEIRPWRKFDWHDVNQEWDFAEEGGWLYVHATKNPALLSSDIRVSLNVHAVYLRSHMHIRDIAVFGTGAHGMQGGWNEVLSDISISDCDFNYIGGSELIGFSKVLRVRYGNGVEFGCGCDGATVERCTFSNIYDVAFTMQGYPRPDGGWKDVVCRNCTMTDCTQAFEIWCTKAPAGVGFEHCRFTGNHTKHVGGGWGALSRPNRQSSTPLLMYSMQTDTVDIDVSGNTFEDAPRGLMYCACGTPPEGYRMHDNVVGGGIVDAALPGGVPNVSGGIVDAALPVRKHLNHRGPLSIDVSRSWYFITICSAERFDYGRAVSMKPPYHGGMKYVISDFKRWLSTKYGVKFQRDFWDTRLRDDTHYAEKYKYICENPIRKGLSDTVETWPYLVKFE